MTKKMMTVFVLLLLAAVSPAQIVMPNAIGSGGGGGSIGSGSTVTSCTSSILTASAASLLACDPASIVNGSVSTAGRSILTIKDTISGASATSNFLKVVGTVPASLSAETNAIYISTTAVNQAQYQAGIKNVLTGTAGTLGGYAIWSESNNAGLNAVGSLNRVVSGAPTNGIGTWGVSESGTNRMGGYFALTFGALPAATAALVADNNAVAANIFEARDNGTAVFTIADGGASTFTQGVNVGGYLHTTGSGFYIGPNQIIDMEGSGGIGGLSHRTAFTPDAMSIYIGSNSNSTHINEYADLSFDFNNGACGTAACTDPGLVIHSAVQDTTQYNHLANWGQAGGALKTLTESAATSVIQIPIANLAGAFGEFCYTVKAADATDSQIRGSCIKYTVTAKAGTETCSLNTQAALTSDASITETEDGSGSGAITTGTLTYAITCSTTPSNAVDIQINAVSSLTQTTLNVTYKVNHVGPGQPARQ